MGGGNKGSIDQRSSFNHQNQISSDTSFLECPRQRSIPIVELNFWMICMHEGPVSLLKGGRIGVSCAPDHSLSGSPLIEHVALLSNSSHGGTP